MASCVEVTNGNIILRLHELGAALDPPNVLYSTKWVTY